MDEDREKVKRSTLGKAVDVVFHDRWAVVESVGAMRGGAILGALVGGGGALWLGLSVVSGLLAGAVVGFVLVVLLQMFIIGGG